MDLEQIISEYIECYNNFRIDEMLDLFATDCIFENISNSNGIIKISGKDELKSLVEKYKEIFSTKEQQIINLYTGDNHAVAEIIFKGILINDSKIDLRGVSIFEIENGKIKRLADYS